MSYSLNCLNGGYLGDYIEECYRDCEGGYLEVRLHCSSHRFYDLGFRVYG